MKAALAELLTQLRHATVDGVVPERVFAAQARTLGLGDAERDRLREELARLGLPVHGAEVHTDTDRADAGMVARSREENMLPRGEVVRALLRRYTDPEGYVTARAVDGVARLAGLGAREAAALRAEARGLRDAAATTADFEEPDPEDVDIKPLSMPTQAVELEAEIRIRRRAFGTAAAMLQGAWELPEEHRDAYWTLVAYHHSLRELGRTVTAAADDIPAQLTGLDSGAGVRELADHQVQELTSNLPRAERPVLLDRLEKPWTDPQAVSFLPCTNMLSVGVDVKRLALMPMQGQPKTTAEYIQATSRVGRHAVPGLVVAFFNATRPRDRSHHETFDVYHRSLYRHVEPTSVTPWSVPSRRRALHAALVILVRHRLGLAAEDQAGQVLDRLPEVEALIEELTARAGACEPLAADAVRKELAALLADWEDAAREARKDGGTSRTKATRSRPRSRRWDRGYCCAADRSSRCGHGRTERND